MSRRANRIRETRAVPGIVSAEDRAIEGLGVPYGVETELWPGYFEQFLAGAFEESLRRVSESGREVRSYFNHDRNIVLGSTPAGTLELESLSDGLHYRTPEVVKTRAAEDVLELVRAGEVIGSSVGFVAERERELIDEEGNFHRSIVEARLYDVGPVSEAAYPSTTAEARERCEAAVVDALEHPDPCRAAMREVGLSDHEIEVRFRAARERFEIPASGVVSLETLRLRHRQVALRRAG